MMTETVRLKLPLLAAAQSQKHVTVNEALTILDLFAGIIPVASRALSTPAGTEVDGDVEILADAGTGDWDGFETGDLAFMVDGGWRRVLPGTGMIASVADESGILLRYTGSAWVELNSDMAPLDSPEFTGTPLAPTATAGTSTTQIATTAFVAAAISALVNSAPGALDTLKELADALGDDSNFAATVTAALALKAPLAGPTFSGIVTTAGQLAFPSTQNPSADANTLDDYEEGTWTPAVTFGGSATGVTYGSCLGRYTRIGNLVTISGMLTLTSKGTSTGPAAITGLPFTSLNDSIYTSIAVGYAGGFSSVSGSVLGLIAPNGSKVSLYQSANGAAAGLTNSQFTNSSAVYFTASYQAQ